MHEPVIGRLEEYLGGGGPFADVEEHLNKCPGCREELDAMRMQSSLFQALRAPREVELPAGFYARVINQIDTQSKPSIWSVFGESLFAKRLAYVSATFLILLGSVLVSSTTQTAEPLAEAAPEYILAGDYEPVPVSMENTEQGRDVVFVNLATYQQD